MSRVAAIDCGTNSIRLLIADVTDGRLRDVHREMQIVRLGQGVDATGQFAPDALARTRAALVDYAALLRRFPGLVVAGTYSPPFRPLTPEEDEQIVAMINRARPDIVWVGLGAPKQEYWMAEHVGRLEAPVMVGVGAAFDFHSGRKKQAPRWMQRSGLEWLFRLLTEPRRLWRRYLINNPLFLWLVALQLLGLRRYSLDGLPGGAE